MSVAAHQAISADSAQLYKLGAVPAVEAPEVELRPSGMAKLYGIRSSIWLADFLLDWAIIIGTFVAFSYAPYWYLVPVAALMIGARAHALGLLFHDATHRVAFKTKWLNDFFGEVFIAWPLFVVMGKGYRPWHFQHHKLLGTEDDPELSSYRDDEPYVGKVTWWKIRGIFVLDMLGFGVIGLFRFLRAVFPFRQPLRYLGPVAMWVAFFAVTFYFEKQWIFWLWLWSVITGFWAVFRIRTWTEHVGVEPEGKATSHRFNPGPLARFLFFPHNTFCHYEHHKWPQVPYYNLPKLREMDRSKPVLTLKEIFPGV